MASGPKGEKRQEKEIADRVAPPGEILYEAIYREGAHELKRGNRALALSGLAAGLSMGFSFLTEGLLRGLLPHSEWAPMVAKLGYAVGFVIVILGRQQLFTKNTLTMILPLLNRRSGTPSRLRDVARLWAIILGANLCGAAAFAAVMGIPGLFSAETQGAFKIIGAEAASGSFTIILIRSILAGWLIALMIWLLPFAETARLWVISGLACVVGIGHLPHVIAGSVSTLYTVFSGDTSFGHYVGGFLVPSLIGNALGGVALVAVGPTQNSSKKGMIRNNFERIFESSLMRPIGTARANRRY